MKAISFKIPMTEEASVRVQEDRMSHFYDRLHFHPEYQFTLIVKGFGNCLVGDQMVEFAEGDVFFLGSDLPHLFKCDESFYQDPEIGVYAISVFFREEIFGETFFALPEMLRIKDLLGQSSKGLLIEGAMKEAIGNILSLMPEKENFARLQAVLEMLHLCSMAKAKGLSNLNWLNIGEERDERLGEVLQYLMDHYAEPIRLEEVAAIANLTHSAFCRFFKLRTGKTFVRFLNEVRIGIACRRLREEKTTISEIAYEVGFQNLSNFNRQFRLIVGRKPSDI